VKPENKETLTKILTYHVVSGRMAAKDLAEAVKKVNGKAMLKTIAGGDLTVTQPATRSPSPTPKATPRKSPSRT
jgi:uncharacterized surface protein with fasciclin (FAS1) repeats